MNQINSNEAGENAKLSNRAQQAGYLWSMSKTSMSLCDKVSSMYETCRWNHCPDTFLMESPAISAFKIDSVIIDNYT